MVTLHGAAGLPIGPCGVLPTVLRKALLTFPDRDSSDFHLSEAAICCIVQHRTQSACPNSSPPPFVTVFVKIPLRSQAVVEKWGCIQEAWG